MSESRACEVLHKGYSGRLGTCGADGWPYVVPLLYVCMDGRVLVHTSRAEGHLALNLRNNARVCFVVDEPGEVYGYGRFECDSSLAYASVMVFATMSPVLDDAGKTAFCTLLMEKYGRGLGGRPAGFFPRLASISVYALTIDRMSGKEIVLPDLNARWPMLDRTRSPEIPRTPTERDR